MYIFTTITIHLIQLFTLICKTAVVSRERGFNLHFKIECWKLSKSYIILLYTDSKK
uniref:Uncharacterized protein n=1 Tax=Anguilla anguilla TaxID=7936 RepID=A0A0E9WAV7_ANGAN